MTARQAANSSNATASDWREYDYAAAWCARHGIKGKLGDSLPDLLSVRCCDLIDEDPEAFQERIRLIAYADAMARAERK